MVADPLPRRTGGIVTTMPLNWWELLLILLVVLLLFGAKRLPEMGRSLGKGMREFKDAVSGIGEESTPAPPAELPSAPSEPTSAPRHEAEAADEAERETVR
jgi:sec-independent protein translocase protein TatA